MLNQRLMPVFFMATMDMDSTVSMDTTVLPTTDMPTMVTMDILMPTMDITMVRGLLMLSLKLMPVFSMVTMDMVSMDTTVLPTMVMPTTVTMDIPMLTTDITMVRGLLMLSQLLMLTMPTMDMDMPTMDTMDTHMPIMDTTDIIINLFSIC